PERDLLRLARHPGRPHGAQAGPRPLTRPGPQPRIAPQSRAASRPDPPPVLPPQGDLFAPAEIVYTHRPAASFPAQERRRFFLVRGRSTSWPCDPRIPEAVLVPQAAHPARTADSFVTDLAVRGLCVEAAGPGPRQGSVRYLCPLPRRQRRR